MYYHIIIVGKGNIEIKTFPLSASTASSFPKKEKTNFFMYSI